MKFDWRLSVAAAKSSDSPPRRGELVARPLSGPHRYVCGRLCGRVSRAVSPAAKAWVSPTSLVWQAAALVLEGQSLPRS
jgi:hypothetical protein